jgi:hypothetical protein
MSDTSQRSWDLWLKTASAAGFLIAALISYNQYLDTARRELRRPFLEQRLAICVDVSTQAATIVTESQPAADRAAREALEKLYWGPLAIFDNKAVADAVEMFRSAMQDGKKPDHKLAERIAHACRDLMQASWYGRDPITLPR